MNRKIVYVLTRMIVGGAQETGKATAEHFRRRGDSVLLITGAEAGREGNLRADVPTIVLPTLVRGIEPRNDVRALWLLYRIFSREKPDIVHARTAKARFLAPLVARLARVPTIVQTIHGYSFNNEIDNRRGLYILVERLVARCCHCNVVVSEADLEEGRRLGILRRENTVLIRSGVDVAKVQAADPEKAMRLRAHHAEDGGALVTLVGRLSMPKTPDVFVDAAARVLQTHRSTRFLVVGDGQKREEIRARIDRLGIADRVSMLGLRDDVPDIIAASDVIVHSSTHEGLPKTVLEGMAAGKPVVASRVGGVPAAVEHGVSGLLVEPLDAGELAGAIEALVAEPSLRTRLGAAASRRAEEYSLDRTLAETEQLYDKLVVRGRR